MVVTKKKAEKIERSTQEQASSEQWKSKRTEQLTASKVGGIAMQDEKNNQQKKVQEFSYSVFRGTKATQYRMKIKTT